MIPFEAADEMGGSRIEVVKAIARDADYRAWHEALFGSLPPLSWFDALPVRAGPYGDSATRAARARLPKRDRHQVNRIYVRVGQALEAYQRTLVPQPSALDRYVDKLLKGDARAARSELSAPERRGLRLFISERTRCLRCHHGHQLTNGGFHNIGTGKLTGDRLDFGRAFGLQAVLMDEFNCLGPYSAASPEECVALRFLDRSPSAHLEGAFKVPGLRLVSKTAPYFHDGRFSTLEEVVRLYNEPTVRVDGVDLDPMDLSDEEVADLTAFLNIL